MGNSVCRQVRYSSENHHIHEHGKERRYEVPPEAEDCLLELHRKVTLDKKPDQISFLPQFAQAETTCLRVRGNNCVIIFIVLFQCTAVILLSGDSPVIVLLFILPVMVLHRVHKGFLYFIEEHQSKDEQDERDQCAIAQPEPRELPYSEEGVLDCLHHWCDGIERHSKVQFVIRDHTQGVNDRGDIDPEGDNLRQHNLQVTVLGCQGRENHSESHRHERQEQHQEGEEDDLPMDSEVRVRSRIIDIESEENSQLDSKREQVDRHRHHRHDDTREIDLAEDVRIRDERVGGRGKA